MSRTGPRALSSPRASSPRAGRVELGRHWAVRLTTFRRNGTPVSTPVNVAVDGGRVFFRTYEQAGKFKRLRNDARVLVAPSDARGTPTGPEMPARAALLTGPDDLAAGELIDAKHTIFHRLLVRTAHKLRRLTTRHFELHPVDGPRRLPG